MNKLSKIIICTTIFSCCFVFQTKADELLFNGEKGKLLNVDKKPDPENPKNIVGLRRYPVKGTQIYFIIKNKDWSKQQGLAFRIYSEKADGHSIFIRCKSNEQQKATNCYYYHKLKIDWQGWKYFMIPFKSFNQVNDPVGWHKIDSLIFHFHGWGLKNNPEGKYYFDDIELISKI
jgi:carbohydrate binding protein with CBM11 domain